MAKSGVLKKLYCGGNYGLSVGGTLASGDRLCLGHQIEAQAVIPSYRSYAQSLASTSLAKQRTPATTRLFSSPSEARIKKQTLDRDVIVSVLEAAATKRDAKGYLQKYTSNPKPEAPKFIQGQQPLVDTTLNGEPANVAILIIRDPQNLERRILDGIAKTLSQLRVLGLLSIVVVDCTNEENNQSFEREALRLCESIDLFGKPGAKLVRDVFVEHSKDPILPAPARDDIRVDDCKLLQKILQRGLITVVSSLARRDDISAPRPAEVSKIVLALTKYLIGLQFSTEKAEKISTSASYKRPAQIASVERVILLDDVGGTPVPGRPGVCHRFINLEQEYDNLVKHLVNPNESSSSENTTDKATAAAHTANLSLVKDALSVLPPTSSALITTPVAAANTTSSSSSLAVSTLGHPQTGFNSMVTTRRRQNPLLHNLLTDKPVFSSSLPFQRIQNGEENISQPRESTVATLVKRGMPVTIYPNPRISPWQQPKPGLTRLRLTDKCIDLPRLVHLIEDSFNRKLDIEDYLRRVNENLAGIIIAGEYEGGAILTWENPYGTEHQGSAESTRRVPYLDKFAVLKSRQGSGGVADIVFNAMVQDCFPEGVCWRSRKDNPVNKWYFERSVGVSKLLNSNWTMFWTTPGLSVQDSTLRDYETVCRNVLPSWADNKHILD